MKNTVLYALVIMAGLLMVSTEVFSQKPAINLLPFTHQRIHPEAILDTGFTADSQRVIMPLDPAQKYPSSDLLEKGNRPAEENRKWVDFDSLLKRQVLKDDHTDKSSVNYSLIFKFINPIKIFLYITALK